MVVVMIGITLLQMKEVYANMTDLQASFDELYAVYSKVVARSHTIPVKVEMQPGVFDWKYMPALVPLVDMMNQGIQNTGSFPRSACSWFFIAHSHNSALLVV